MRSEELVVSSDKWGLWREAAAETERQLMPGTEEAATATQAWTVTATVTATHASTVTATATVIQAWKVTATATQAWTVTATATLMDPCMFSM